MENNPVVRLNLRKRVKPGARAVRPCEAFVPEKIVDDGGLNCQRGGNQVVNMQPGL